MSAASGQSNARLWNVGYVSLLVAQFFGAANDNILKQCLIFMVTTGIWHEQLGEGGQVVPALCLTIPFIVLSGYAGQVADRYSKQQVTRWIKLVEIPIAALAFVGFQQENLWLTLGALLLLSSQSAFFGPAKYGAIPELMAESHLSKANGFINMFTNLAIIAGSLLAGPISDLYLPEDPNQTPLRWVPGAAMVTVAILGYIACLAIPRLPAADPNLTYNYNPFATYWSSLKEMAASPLLTVALAWAGFYMIGMMALLIVPEYERILGISYAETSYLVGILGIAIAVGSVSAGMLSGEHIRPWFIPFGATGMTVCFGLLGLLAPEYKSVAALIFFAGVFAGFYIVPLQALMQALSPDNERGRFLGTANALSFCFTTGGSLLYWIVNNRFGMPPNRVHLVCATLALSGTVIGVLRLRRLTGR
ncbi:MAG: MFS transporter [Planctomycetales bacterium]|nr:MFS transporter [Planctomycetales bacterium]